MKYIIFVRYLLIVAFISFVPGSAHAAIVYLEASRSNVSVGDTLIVTAKINAEGVTLNTVEGDLAITAGAPSAKVQEFSLGSSSFGLWPRTPSLSKDGQVITFVGGTPGGFNIEGATMFKVIFEAKKEGTMTILPQNISAYLNDGKGTKAPLQVKGVTITVGARKSGTVPVDEWGSMINGDITPPGEFIIVLGQDANLFEGKKFAFFSALDNQSGVSYYEVSENGAPAVRSGSTYVLQDQSGQAKLTVTAFDKAGNKKTATYSANTQPTIGTLGISSLSLALIVLGVIVLLIIVIAIYRKFRNK